MNEIILALLADKLKSRTMGKNTLLQTLSIYAFIFLCIVSSTTSKKNNVLKLTDSTWRKSLTGEWMIKFYAPWCPACQALASKWEKVADWSQDLGVSIAEVDVTEEPGLSGRFFITALPTIYHVKDGEFRRYTGARSDEEIISFLDEGKYKEIEPVSFWSSPTSPQMSLVSTIFRISMQVRALHNLMTEEYGFPTWLSYVVFGLATIATGLILGFILVIIADCLCPPKPYRPPPPPQSQAKPKVPEQPQSPANPQPQESPEDAETAPKEDTNAPQQDAAEQPTEEVIGGKDEVDEETTVRQRKVVQKPDGETEGEGGQD